MNEKTQNSKIFATPPLMKFNCSKDMFIEKEWEKQLKEWVGVLMKENEKLKEASHQKVGLVASETATLLIIASKRLGVSAITKFLAFDIYQKFCLLHIEEMTKHVFKEGLDGDNAIEYMRRVQTKVGQQAPLRVLTCFWIASKLTTHKRTVTKEAVKELLNECGTNISVNTLCKSELRILEQIQFNCLDSSTLPEYVGILIAIVGTIPNSEGIYELTGLVVDGLYQTSLQVLEFVFCNYDLVYEELFFRVTGSRVVSDRHLDAFARVRCDKMLLASSAVGVAGWIHGRDDMSSSFIEKLSSFTEIPADDSNTFSACIIKCLFNN